jgi:hypothetical protein
MISQAVPGPLRTLSVDAVTTAATPDTALVGAVVAIAGGAKVAEAVLVGEITAPACDSVGNVLVFVARVGAAAGWVAAGTGKVSDDLGAGEAGTGDPASWPDRGGVAVDRALGVAPSEGTMVPGVELVHPAASVRRSNSAVSTWKACDGFWLVMKAQQ